MADSHGKIKIISYALLAFGLAFPLLIFILPVSGQTVGTYSYYSIALNFISIPAIVMAGLIRSSKSEEVKKVPFLGDIPLIGAAFRNKSWPENKETEISNSGILR